MYMMIGLVLFVPSVIETLPLATIDAILFFVGVAGLFECELYERLLLIFRAPSTFPASKTYTRVGATKMHAYTALQIACLGVCWAVNLSPAGLLFSVIVCLLVPFRQKVVPVFFDKSELDLLDRPDADNIVPGSKQ